PPDDALPRRAESAEHLLIDRLDFVTQLRERPPSQHPEHAGIGPLAPGASRPELALDKASLAAQTQQRGLGGRRGQSITRGEIVGRERRVRARIAQREVADRVANGLQQRLRYADR